MKLHERLDCIGYYGFGGGFNLAVSRLHFECNECPAKDECWTKHKERVATLFPEATKTFEDMAKRVQGPDLATQWFNTFGSVDPYTLVMTGNMEDGSLVSSNLPPANRGPGTLPHSLWKKLVKEN